jgi:putative ABC transport system permease protein
MNLREALETAFRNLAAHKLRSSLAMLGMIFGVGAVIAMLAIGAGGERAALEMIDRLGVRNVILRAKTIKSEDVQEIRKKSLGLSQRDGEAIREAIAGVDLVVPRIEVKPWKILSSGGKTEAKVYGVSWRLPELSGLSLARGRFLDSLDESEHAQVCVIGEAVRRDLFGFSDPLGKLVKVNDLWLEVVGLLESTAGGASSIEGVPLSSTDREIYLPVTTASRKLERDPAEAPVDELVVRLDEGVSGGGAAPGIRDLVDRLHGGAADWELIVPEALLEQSRRTQRLFQIVMGSIAGISLLVGGIGIMNIMLASVLERTREIGLRRALGATRREIRTQFVIESFAIAGIGGVAGVTFGLVLAKVVAAAAGWPTVVTAASLLLSTGVSALVGLASGIYPATRAAAQDPIEALRYE